VTIKREWTLANKHSAKGSPFQSEGSTTEKARFCLVVKGQEKR